MATAIVFLGSSAMRLLAQSRVSGTLYDSLITSTVLKGATVSIVGTARTAVTDDRGRFHLDSVPTGPHEITFFHATLDSLRVAAPVIPIDVPVTGDLRVALATPSPRALRDRVCPALTDSTTGALIGQVRDVDSGSALEGAQVFTAWTEVTPTNGQMRSDVRRITTTTNAGGVYTLCGVPNDVPVFVRARLAAQTSGAVEAYLDRRDVAFQHFAISLSDTTARAALDSASDRILAGTVTRPPGSARIAGTVREIGGRPVKNARVSVLGTADSALTDDAGRFRFGHEPAGTQTLEVRAIGFAPSRHAVDLRSNEAAATDLTIDRRVAVLPSVRVVGSATPIDRTGFAERERIGLGGFLNTAQIEHMSGWSAMDVLWRAPGLVPVTLKRNGRWVKGVTMRGTLGLNTGRSCIPNFYIDGVRLVGGWDLLDSFLTKSEIAGVEVYVGFGTIPPQFDSVNGCGSVVIWRKQ